MKIDILSDVKIIKRHSVGGIIIGILALFAVAVPVLYWFFPWLQIRFSDITNASESLAYEGGQVSVFIWNIFKCLINKPDGQTALIIHNGWVNSGATGNIMKYYIIRENIYAAGIWYGISVISTLALFINGLVLLIRGRLKNSHGLVTAAGFFMFSNGMFLLDSWRLGAYMQWACKEACAVSGSAITIKFSSFYSIILGASAGVLWLIILILYLATLKGKYYKEDIEIIDTGDEESAPKAEDRLPKGLTYIPDHAYAKNTKLKYADIEYGVEEIGIGAFANCINLKTVSLPKTLKRIGSNSFFNTPRLKYIKYNGSKEDWRRITRGSNWLAESPVKMVRCKNGPLKVDAIKPYK